MEDSKTPCWRGPAWGEGRYSSPTRELYFAHSWCLVTDHIVFSLNTANQGVGLWWACWSPLESWVSWAHGSLGQSAHLLKSSDLFAPTCHQIYTNLLLSVEHMGRSWCKKHLKVPPAADGRPPVAPVRMAKASGLINHQPYLHSWRSLDPQQKY